MRRAVPRACRGVRARADRWRGSGLSCTPRSAHRSFNVSEAHTTEILDLVKNSHYQIACTRLYEVTHKLDTQLTPFTHPNAYADMSLGRPPRNNRGGADGAPIGAGAAPAAATAPTPIAVRATIHATAPA